jgi:hypothetical protein
VLQTQSIGKPLWDLLKHLQKEETFSNYFLVGGTALALQLGHRISNDINDIKVDFVRHNYTLLEDIKSENGIKYLGKKDISAMKLMAIANRGDQAKDFVDIYYLLNEISLRDMFEYYKQKYNQNDISPIKRSLVYFDDVTKTNWESVKLLKDTLSIEMIKQTIINEMNNYNESKSILGDTQR